MISIFHTALIIVVKVSILAIISFVAHLLTSLPFLEVLGVIYALDTLLFLFNRYYDRVQASLWYAARRGRLF